MTTSAKAIFWLPIRRQPGRNSICSGGTSQCSAAKSIRRFLMVLQALSAAMPLMSEPEEAAVAEVLGTLPVEVAVIRTRSMSTWKASATTWATLV